MLTTFDSFSTSEFESTRRFKSSVVMGRFPWGRTNTGVSIEYVLYPYLCVKSPPPNVPAVGGHKCVADLLEDLFQGGGK